MTSHKFYKRGLVTAEQFDGSEEMADRYGIQENVVAMYETQDGPQEQDSDQIKTLEGWLDVKVGDWIATGINGEHWPIVDDIFRKTYASLPVIPRAVGMVIRKHREAGRDLAYALYEAMRVHSRRGRTDGKSAFSWIAENQDTFALAWLLGEWEVENG